MAENYLFQLSDFLRISISFSNKKTASLGLEIEFMETYLKMQTIRFGDALQWNIQVKRNQCNRYLLPVFSLQPLAENAIKHNRFSTNNPLVINVIQENDDLLVSNEISSKKRWKTQLGVVYLIHHSGIQC